MRTALALLALVACDASPPAWPAWPANAEAAGAVVAEHTRPSRARRDPTADDVISAIDTAAEERTLIAGWRPIAAALRSREVVIAGMHHDAEGQHAAFRRLFGPTGTNDRRTLVLELFDADGRWDGALQAGDQAVLDAYAEHGDRASLDAVRARLRRGAYTAWKYDLIDELLATVIAARAGSQRVLGCDLPPALMRRTFDDEQLSLRMRELHCALAMRDAPRPIAVLIGDTHTAPEGLPSFVRGAIVLRLIGGRRSDAGIEPALAARLAITEPLLVPLRGELLLIVPDARLSADSDISRVRERPSSPGTIAIDADGTVTIDGRAPSERLAVGDHTFVVSRGTTRIAGGLRMPESTSIELIVYARSVTRVWTSSRADPP